MADSMVAPAERTLPHNLEAERSVLGAILVQNDAFNLAAQVLKGEDFYRDAHRRIFDGMAALSERSHAIDFVTLKEELSRTGNLDDVGGPAYVASLADGVPRATNVEYYARIVKEKATLRNLIYAANKIVAEAYGAEQESDLILDEAERSIFAVAEDRLKAGFVEMRDLVKQNFPKIEQQKERMAEHAGNALAVASVICAAGVLTGILSGTKMIDAMGHSVVSLVPAALGPHLAIITGLLSIPFTFFLSNDAFYFGVLPILAQAAATFGISAAEVGRASIIGQPVHLLSPLVPSTYLLVGLAEVELGDHQKFTLKWSAITALVLLAIGLLTAVIPWAGHR